MERPPSPAQVHPEVADLVRWMEGQKIRYTLEPLRQALAKHREDTSFPHTQWVLAYLVEEAHGWVLEHPDDHETVWRMP